MIDTLAAKLFIQDHLPPHVFLLGKKHYYRLKAIPCIVGRRVACPCCGHHLRRFVFFRGQPILCPWCGSLPRHRLLCLYLQNCTNLFRDRLTVLYFAPDALERKLRTSPNLTYISTDLDSPDAMVHMDITDIPFSDHTFDVIICSHVLEHVPDDRKAMSELYRILKRGGRAIILVPFELDRAATFEDPSVVDRKERIRLFGQHDHVRRYGQDFITRLEQAGFIVSQELYAHELDPSAIGKYVLSLDEAIFSCKHP